MRWRDGQTTCCPASCRTCRPANSAPWRRRPSMRVQPEREYLVRIVAALEAALVVLNNGFAERVDVLPFQYPARARSTDQCVRLCEDVSVGADLRWNLVA